MPPAHNIYNATRGLKIGVLKSSLLTSIKLLHVACMGMKCRISTVILTPAEWNMNAIVGSAFAPVIRFLFSSSPFFSPWSRWERTQWKFHLSVEGFVWKISAEVRRWLQWLTYLWGDKGRRAERQKRKSAESPLKLCELDYGKEPHPDRSCEFSPYCHQSCERLQDSTVKGSLIHLATLGELKWDAGVRVGLIYVLFEWIWRLSQHGCDLVVINQVN